MNWDWSLGSHFIEFNFNDILELVNSFPPAWPSHSFSLNSLALRAPGHSAMLLHDHDVMIYVFTIICLLSVLMHMSYPPWCSQVSIWHGSTFQTVSLVPASIVYCKNKRSEQHPSKGKLVLNWSVSAWNNTPVTCWSLSWSHLQTVPPSPSSDTSRVQEYGSIAK